MVRLPVAVSVPSKVPAISASSTCTSPLNTPEWLMTSSCACSSWLSMVPSMTSFSASVTVPCRLMPLPISRVRRSAASARAPARGAAAGVAAGAAGTRATPAAGAGAAVGFGAAGPAGSVTPEGRKGGIARSESRATGTVAGAASGWPASSLRRKIDMSVSPRVPAVA